MNYKVLIAATLAAATVAVVEASTVDEALPAPWFKNGQAPAVNECKAGVDTDIEKHGTPNLTLQCAATSVGFVSVMQNFAATDYLGKRVRFSALVKSQDIEKWSGLWMRIDATGRQGAAFDNMENRPVKGTSDWTPYSIVLDVPQNAEGVFFGALMLGKGQLWISDLRFEVVGADIPTTGTHANSGTKPGNLGLSR